MVKLIGQTALDTVVAHQPGVYRHIETEAKKVEEKAKILLESARATTHWHKMLGPGHLTSISMEHHEVDAYINLNAPNPMGIEYGHFPSGYYEGTNTKSPHGLYILNGAAGFPGESGGTHGKNVVSAPTRRKNRKHTKGGMHYTPRKKKKRKKK